MKTHCSFSWPSFLLITALSGSGYGSLLGSAPPDSEQAEITFEVLERREIDLGHRKVILNRVVPPDLPERPPKDLQAEPREWTEEERAALASRADKRHETPFIEAIAHDSEVTELWWRFEGKEYRCWSNAPVDSIRAFQEVETEEAVFSFMILPVNAGDTDRWRPSASDFSSDHADYLVLGDDARDAQAFAAIEALHRFVDEYGAAELKAEHAAREVARLERERELAENPPEPEPKDTVIHYWPVRSQTHR